MATYKWEVGTNSATYKVSQNDDSNYVTVASISGDGLKVSGTAGTLLDDPPTGVTFSEGVFTVTTDALNPTGTVTVTGGTLTLSVADEYGATTTYAVDTPSGGTAKVKVSKTEGWKMSENNTSATWTAATTDQEIATISLSYTDATGGLSITDNTKPVVTVTDDAFNTTEGGNQSTISVSGDVVTLVPSFAPGVSANKTKTGTPTLGTFTSGQPLKVTRTDSAFYSATDTSIRYTSAKTYDLAEITGLQSSTGLSLPTEEGSKEIEITTAMVGNGDGAAVEISGNGGYTIKLKDTDDNPNDGKVGYETVDPQWYTGAPSGNFDYKSGYTAEGWKQDGDTKITYEADTKSNADDYKTLTTISGEGLSATTAEALNATGAATVDTNAKTVTLAGSVLGTTADKTVSVDQSYKITVADDQQFDHDASTQNLDVVADGTDAKITRKQNAGWQNSGTSKITYKAQVAALELATIEGLKEGVTGVSVNNSATTVAGKTVVTLAAGALKSGENDTYTVTIADATGAGADTVFTGFTLALDNAVNTDDAKDAGTVTLSVTSGTATVKKDYAEYWTLAEGSKSVTYTGLSAGAGDTVAEITGLADTAAKDTNVILDAANSKIKLKDGALKKATDTATGAGATLASDTYSVELDSSVTQDADKYETDVTKVTLNFTDVTDGETVTGKTATLNKNKKEYWGIDGKTVTYTAAANGTAEDDVVATLTGLATTATDTNVVLDAANSKIKLKDGALKKATATAAGAGATLESTAYTLELDGSINTNASKDNGTVTLSVTDGTATVKKDYAEYWTLTDNKTVTYTAKVAGGDSTAVMTISDLNDSAAKDTDVILDDTTKKITLKNGALKDSDATVTGTTYTIELGDDVIKTATDEEDDTKVTMTVAAAVSPATGYVATVKKDQQKYWTVESGTVKFHAATTGTGTTVATLSGLSSTAGASNVELDKENKTLTVSKDALVATAGSAATLDSTTYSLLTNTDVDKPAKEEGTPTLDDSKLSEGKATYKRTPSAGWTLSGKTITYSQPEDVILAEITGLKNGASKEKIHLNTSTKVITVDADALDAETDGKAVTFTSNTAGYTFARGTGVVEPAAKVTSPTLDSVSGGKAIIEGTTSAGWTLAADSKKLTYVAAKTDQEVATVEGLNTDAKKNTDVLFDDFTGNITLTKDALKAGDVTLTTNYKYQLVLDGADGSGNLGGEAFDYWTKQGTTAEYYTTNKEKWTLDTTSKKTITYTPLEGTTPTKVATINGLSRDTTLGAPVIDSAGKTKYTKLGTGKYDEDQTKNTFVDGATVSIKTITLNKNILGTDADNAMTYTLAAGYTIKLNDNTNDEDGFVQATAAPNTKFWELGPTVKYKQANLEYWTNDTTTKEISYSPRGTETLLATITGLKADVTKNDLAVAGSEDSDGKTVITLNKNALAGRDVNIDSTKYKLALNTSDDNTVKVATPVESEKAWELNDAKTIATYKAKVSEGYTAASDGSSITYTPSSGDNKVTLAEVTGLNGKSDLVINDDKQSIGIKDATNTYTAALSFGTDDNAKQITLTKDVLGTSNVKVTGTNYTLAIDDASLTKGQATGINASTGKVEYTAPPAADVWRVEKGENDSTTAIYKNIIPTFYLIGVDATEITYMPEATKKTYATVTGLKSGLTVADDGKKVKDATETTEVLTLADKVITLKDGALGTTDILLDGEGYELSLGKEATAKALAPAMADSTALTWSVDGTTATLNGLRNEGWELDTVSTSATKDKKITYTEANPNYTFVKLTGLKEGLTNADLNVSSGSKPIDYDFSTNKVLTLNNSVLGTTTVALDQASTDAGYTLALNDSDVIDADDKTTVNVWAFKDGTATYQTVREAYYNIPSTGDNEGKIVYTARDTSGTELAKITGLKSGLTVVDGAIAGITPDNANSPNKFTISRDVLTTGNATIASGANMLELDDDAAPVKTSEDYWTVSGTKASYQFDTSAGYTLDSNTIKYQAEKKGTSANTIVTIDGLKSGVNKATVESNIAVGDTGIFTLSKPVLGTTPITLTVGKEAELVETAYKLALDSTDSTIGQQSKKVGWAKNTDNSYTLKQYTPEYWEVETGDKKIKYTAGALGSAIATVTGLKTTLTPNTTTAQIAGIEVDPSTNKITVSKSVLTTNANTPAKITKADGASVDYTFDLGSDVAKPAYSKKWTASRGTATLTENITLGYTGDGTAEVKYQPKKTVTTTISGLDQTKLTIGTGNQSISGITLKKDDGTNLDPLTAEEEKALTEIRDGKFYVASTLLNNKTVTLTNKSGGGTYQLALDGITAQSVDGAQWYKAANATVATYETRVAKGYVVNDSDNPTKYTYYSADANNTVTTLATLKGLAKTATQEQVRAAINTTIPVADNPSTTDTDKTEPGVFTINNKEIFGKNDVTLTSTDYVLKFDVPNNFAISDIENQNATWTYNSKKGTADLVAGKTEGWAFQVKNNVTNYKTIKYTKAAPKIIASVSGLAPSTTAKPITVSADGKALTYTDEYGEERKTLEATFSNGSNTDYVGKENLAATATIKVDAGVLTNKNVTVTPKQTGYTFAFTTDTDVYTPKDTENYWATDVNGKAFYRYDTSAGYTLDKQKATDAENANNKITYSAFKTTTLATISGLMTTKLANQAANKAAGKKAVAKIERAEQLDGITVTKADFTLDDKSTANNEYDPGIFTLWDDSILTNKVTLGGKDNYKFAVSDEIDVDTGTVENKQAKWYFSNGTATYRLYDKKGYTTTNDRTAVFKAETAGTTLVTLQGLAKKIDNKPITADKINQENLLLVNEDNTITISDDIKNNTTITLIDGTQPKATKTAPTVYYQYTIDTNSFDKPTAEAPVWTSISKGTATLKQKTSAGYTLSDTKLKNNPTQVTGQKLTYSEAVNPTIATVKGLATNLAIPIAAQITAAAAATTPLTLKANTIYTATTTKSGNTTTTTFSNDTPVLDYDATTKVITVKADALAAKNVTVSGSGNYKLALGSDITNKTAKNVTEWVVSGTEAKYKNYDKAFYALSGDKTIKYTADTAGITYATVKGLASGSTIITATAFKKVDGSNAGDKDGGVLTLTKDNLGTSNITIASNVAGKDTFMLALDSDANAEVSKLTLSSTSFTANNSGTATIKGKLSKGFTLEFGGKQLTYNNTDNKDVTVATVTGLKKNASINVDTGAHTITLGNDDLANKNVAVTTSWGTTDYTLNLSGSGFEPTKDITTTGATGDGTQYAPKTTEALGKKIGWTVLGTTGTLKGYVKPNENLSGGGGYTVAEGAKTITYTAPTGTSKSKTNVYTYKDTSTLATIKGLKSGLTTTQKNALIDTTGSTPTIKLSKSNTNGNLTINGGTYAVEVASDYTGKSITGSAGADDLTVKTDGVTITGGKGDDKIDLAASSKTKGNTLIYSSGEGNDVIANFTPGTDKLQVKTGTPLVAKSGDDFIVKVGTGSIMLTGAATRSISATELTILNAKDTPITYAAQDLGSTSGGQLIVDDNYTMDPTNLSSIVKGDSASYSAFDFSNNFSLTKEDKLIPVISYAKDK